MSDVHATPKHSPSNSDLATLAVALQEAARALLAHAPEESEEPAAKPPTRVGDGETRSFYFPPASVHLERELLRKYRVDDFQGLLEEVHTLLAGLVKIMQCLHKDVRVRGYVISSLGAQLEHASSLVHRMRTVYDKVARLQS